MSVWLRLTSQLITWDTWTRTFIMGTWCRRGELWVIFQAEPCCLMEELYISAGNGTELFFPLYLGLVTSVQYSGNSWCMWTVNLDLLHWQLLALQFLCLKEYSHSTISVLTRSLMFSPSSFLRLERYWHGCLNIQHCQSSRIRWVNNNSNKHSHLNTHGRVWSGCFCVMSCAILVSEMKRKCIW